MRHDRIDQLSFDHSLVWELVRRNHLTSEQANLSVPKNVITRSLGPEVEIEVDIEGPLAVELGDVYLLCSDGLSGPVDDRRNRRVRGQLPSPRRLPLPGQSRQSAGRAGQHHRALIVRIGPWIDPDSAEVQQQPDQVEKNDGDRRGREGWRSRLTELIKVATIASRMRSRGRGSSLSNAECPIDEALIDRLDELTRRIQEQAIAQAWSLDWTALASLRRQAADARSANNHWVSLRKLGEIISLLGEAARFFRKNAGSTPFH